MSQASHLVSRTVPGYGLSDSSRCLPCSGVSGRAVTLSTCVYSNVCRSHSQGKTVSLKFATAEASFICRADSRRKSNFSKRNRQGSSQSWNRQIGEKDSTELIEEYETPSPRKGPTLPLSGNPKFQATSVPGPREKEILELFRKVQAQLRERAAIKEEKKIEAQKGHITGTETETVDSLIKLLRKHSGEHGKTNSSPDSIVTDNGRDFMLDDHKHNGSILEEKSSNFTGSNSTVRQEFQKMNPSTRLVSRFRRKSPIPRDNSTPNLPDKVTPNPLPHLNSDEHKRVDVVDADVEPELQGLQPKNDFSDELVFEEVGTVDDVDDDNVEYIEDEKEQGGTRDLTALKLTELRSLAKSSGVKGYSKMKKADLLEFLSGRSI